MDKFEPQENIWKLETKNQAQIKFLRNINLDKKVWRYTFLLSLKKL